MVRETEPDKPLWLVSEGPLKGVTLPAKGETSVVTVTVKPTLWQRIKAAVQGKKP